MIQNGLFILLLCIYFFHSLNFPTKTSTSPLCRAMHKLIWKFDLPLISREDIINSSKSNGFFFIYQKKSQMVFLTWSTFDLVKVIFYFIFLLIKSELSSIDCTSFNYACSSHFHIYFQI